MFVLYRQTPPGSLDLSTVRQHFCGKGMVPRVTEAHREARRAQIRAAALRAFTTKGYQRASISDVVTESGLSAGAIYGHYDGKQALFAAVAEEVLSRRGSEIEDASRDGIPPSPFE